MCYYLNIDPCVKIDKIIFQRRLDWTQTAWIRFCFLWYNIVHIMYGINNVGHIHKWTVVSTNYIYSGTLLSQTLMAPRPWVAQTFFFSPVNIAFISLSNKHWFPEHQFLFQSNYIYGPVIINQYKLPFKTRTQVHRKCQAFN